MDRTISILLVALLAASGAATADLAPLSPATQLDALERPAEGALGGALPDPLMLEDGVMPAAGDAVAALEQAAGPAVAVIQGALACEKAVRVDLHRWGYDVVDARSDSARFLDTVRLTNEVTTMVPIKQTTTEVLWVPAGLLGGLEPVTRTVTQVVGYEPETSEVATLADVAVALAWDEQLLEVDELVTTVYIGLPAGLSLIAQGLGTLVDVCDGSDILPALPQLDCPGYDGCSMLPLSDGWYMELLSLDVRLATDQDQETLAEKNFHGFSLSGAALHERIQDKAQEQGLWPAELLGVRGGDDRYESDASTTQALHVPAQTAGFLGLLGALVAALGTAGFMFVRKP